MKRFFVYLLASDRNGTLYVGMTSDLVRRVWQHKEKVVAGFTEKYMVERLVYFSEFGTAEAAITREKQIKKWNRARKIRLIEEMNPEWDDLYDRLISWRPSSFIVIPACAGMTKTELGYGLEKQQ